MFGLFKRTKLENWEVELLKNVILELPNEYLGLLDQVKDGLFKGVLTNVSDIPGYVSFTYNPKIFKKYDDVREKDFRITNVKVYDTKSNSFLAYSIYVSGGTINGYSLEQNGKNHKIDNHKIDISEFRKEYLDSDEYYKIGNKLTSAEKKLINPSAVYSVNLDGKEFFHIMDLEDGDFIGIDSEKNVFEIRHDPFEIKPILKSLEEVLQ